MAFNSFEHKLLKQLKGDSFYEPEVCVAVSGGADSMALLELLFRLRKPLKINLSVINIHHGLGRNKKQNDFRLKAWRHVQRYCQKNQLDFISNLESGSKKSGKTLYTFNIKPSSVLKSEDDFRKFRYKCFKKLLPTNCVVVTAHHAEDLLETRLIQMVRGTGMKGLKSMQNESLDLWRPLLLVHKRELLSYLKSRGVKFVNDPSNRSNDPLRNWIRNVWLPQLDKKRSGGVENLSNSLQILLNASTDASGVAFKALDEGKINVNTFNTLSTEGKRQALALYMNQLNLKSYSQNHINEVLKRLDSPEKKLNFRLLKCAWTRDAHCIKAKPLTSTKG